MESNNIDQPNTQNLVPMNNFRHPRFVTRISKPWDDRFHVMTTKDNPKLHVFYKELFGKPSHVKHEEILLLDKGSESKLSGSTYSPFLGNNINQKMRRTLSQEQIK